MLSVDDGAYQVPQMVRLHHTVLFPLAHALHDSWTIEYWLEPISSFSRQRRPTHSYRRQASSSSVVPFHSLSASAPCRPTADDCETALPRNGSITARVNPSGPDPAMIALTAEMGEIKISVVELEKERDFYFNKVSPAPPFHFNRLECKTVS